MAARPDQAAHRGDLRSPQPRVAILCVHPRSAPATRFRIVQHLPYLRAAAQVRLWTFLREKDLSRWYSSGVAGKALLIVRCLPRLLGALGLLLRADLVVVQREALPVGPPLLEWLASALSTLVWDVDDAVWAQHDDGELPPSLRRLRSPSRKFERIATWADEIWVGSDVLAEWGRSFNERVWLLPTVVDAPEALPPAGRDRNAIWIGSPTTSEFLRAILPSITDVPELARVIAVGTDALEPRADLLVRPWSPAAEAETLREGRVGLYPVDRAHPMAEGKCGLKALLYMAHGVPPVVTPTPTNAAIVRHGQEGLHAATPEEWREAVRRLLDNDDLWRSCRESGYLRVKSEYSLEVWGPRVAERAHSLLMIGGQRERE